MKRFQNTQKMQVINRHRDERTRIVSCRNWPNIIERRTQDMKRKKFSSGGIAQVTMGVIMVLSMGLMPACSRSTPACDSGKAVDSVVHLAGQRIRTELSFLTSMGGSPLSDDEWRSLRLGMAINVGNITEKGFNENTGNRICAGTLTVTNRGRKERTPIEYSIELDKASGKLKTTMSGFPKKPEAAPAWN